VAAEQRRAQVEAELLLCALTDKSRSQLFLSLTEPWQSVWQSPLQQAIQRRLQGEPLQYITGRAAFYGRDFIVRQGCLIPRPETEVLVQAASDWLRQRQGLGTVLDLGTGSGVLAVTLALEYPQCCVYAVDNSVDTVDIACENIHLHVADVQGIWADGLELLADLATDGNQTWPQVCPQPGRLRLAKPSLLVSNPPYIASAELATLQSEVVAYEPRGALDGGTDGLFYYRRLAAIGANMFQPGSAGLLLEVGAGQAQQVIDLFVAGEQRWLNWRFTVLPDLRGMERVVFGIRP
jgi:release factor glutamine methyltransferase